MSTHTSTTQTHKLPGLRADSLAGYLGALGLLRVVSRQVDPSARLHWSADTAVLSTCLDAHELASWLVKDYQPSPIVSPWNAGSGFAGNGKSITAEKTLEQFRTSAQPRFGELRTAIQAADQVVAQARARGWEGGPLWAEDHKADVVRLCRSHLPDEALPWLDVAVTLTSTDLRFSPLTGTGGNFGRQELSSTFLQRLALVAGPEAEHAASLAWAEAALLGREDVPYLRETVGQYDPGRAGGILSSPGEKSDDSGFANPWSFILTLEGTLLFASAVTRRNRTAVEDGALPFLARASAVGYNTAATGETVKGEQWIPLWPRPSGLAEIEHLLGEGRVQWNGRQARTGMEFALAIASLGVDRGLSAFGRFVITTRLGQNPLAIPVGQLPVQPHSEVDVLAEPYSWIQRLKRLSLPAGVDSALRRTETQIYAVASGGGPAALRRFLIEFGRLHATASRSSEVRKHIPPFIPRRLADWLALLPDDEELWIAAGFASLRDANRPGSDRSARGLLTRVQQGAGANGRPETAWSPRTATGVELNGATLATALAHVHRLRAIPTRRATSAPPGKGDAKADNGANALREEGSASTGDARAELLVTRAAYPVGLELPVPLLEAYALGEVDDHLIADYLNGLLALGCPPATAAIWPLFSRGPVRPALAALLPFMTTRPLQITRPESLNEPAASSSGVGVQLIARPEWIAQLLATGMPTIADDVRRRLAIAGCPPLLSAADLARMPIDGTRLAGALLLRVPLKARARALAAVTAVIPLAKTKESAHDGS